MLCNDLAAEAQRKENAHCGAPTDGKNETPEDVEIIPASIFDREGRAEEIAKAQKQIDDDHAWYLARNSKRRSKHNPKD